MGDKQRSVLNAIEDWHRTMIDASLNGVLLVDRYDTIVLANAEAEKLFGYEQGELSGQALAKLLPTIPNDRLYRQSLFEESKDFEDFEEFKEFKEPEGLEKSEEPEGVKKFKGPIEFNDFNESKTSLKSDVSAGYSARLQGLRKDDSTFLSEIRFSRIAIYGETLALASIVDFVPEVHDMNQEKDTYCLTYLKKQLENKYLELQRLQEETEESKRALSQSESELRGLAETVPAIVWMTDAHGLVRYINNYWAEYAAVSVDEARGIGWANALHPDDRDRVLEKWSHSCQTGETFKEEYRVKAKDGTFRWFLARGVPLRDQDGKLQEWFGVSSDIDDQKKLLEELGAARDKAEEATRMKSNFLANMSHEIRTPMNAIIGMCNVLQRTDLDKSQRHYVDNLREASNSLLVLLNDILDFSKIEAGQLTLEMSDFDPVRVVESSCELLAASARPKGISLMASIDPQMPKQLRGDPDRLRQILTNLTSNAIKFSDSGEIVVRAEVVSGFADQMQIRFSVKDQGIGISEKDQAKLFQPFVQADDSISRKYGGTGLGLSICKRLVELMGGEIGVESSPGQGSTFWFQVTLPRRSDTPTFSIREELHHVRILIVDDDSQARQIIVSYVESWGMRVATASSPKEALRSLRQAYVDEDPFKVAIVDFVLPGENGVELAKEIFKDPAISNSRLILLAEFDTPGLASYAIESGCKAYLTKPIRQSMMLDSILGALRGGPTIISRSPADLQLGRTSAIPQRQELILVVEDYVLNQQVAQLYLQELGFPIHIVNNGKEALAAISQNNFALVLMDCQMPEMDGFAATRAIREAEKSTNKHLPIVAMTAHSMGGDRERCLQEGMDDYIAKPVEPDELRKILEKWLPATRTAPATESKTAAPKVSEEEPIDINVIHSRYKTQGYSMLRMFVDQVPTEVKRLKEALAQSDQKALMERAHGLKGICTVMYAGKMKKICGQMENAGRGSDWQGIYELVTQLEEEFSRVERYIFKENFPPSDLRPR